MVSNATTVGGYLQSLPNDRRVAMARVCSMIRRSARGVRESMRYGLAFYELEGPLFAVESLDNSLVLYYAEPDAAQEAKTSWKGLDATHQRIIFTDLNCLPLEVVESIVRSSLKVRRARSDSDASLSQNDLLDVWGIKEEDAAASPPIVRINVIGHEDENVSVSS